MSKIIALALIALIMAANVYAASDECALWTEHYGHNYCND